MSRHALLFLCLILLILTGSALADAGPADSATVPRDQLPVLAADSTADSGVVAVDTSASGAAVDETPMYPMDPERKAKMIAYSRFRNIWEFADLFIGIAILLLILATGLSAKLRDWAQVARKRFFVVWLFLILFLVVDYILNLPFDIYRGFIVEKQYGFMQQDFMGWWGENLLGLLLQAIFGIIPMWFLYWVLRKFRRWWLAFSLGAIPFMIIAVVLAPVFISPLFNKFEPLKDQKLRTELTALADKAGIGHAEILEVNASKQSTKLNAYVTGLFGTKRIVLYDTLLKNFTDKEILFVMGHEMGHYVKHDVWKGLGVAILFVMFALWLTDRTIHPVIRRYRSRFKFDQLSDIASLPLILIFSSVIMFVFQPITNTYSRHIEHEADIYGMNITGIDGNDAAITFDKMAVYNLSDPDPSPIIEFWFYDHPALQKRMDFVRSYRPGPQEKSSTETERNGSM